jgi:hypothetical protein
VAALGLLVVVQAVVHEVALEVLQEVALEVLQEVALEVVQEVVQDCRRISNHGNVNLYMQHKILVLGVGVNHFFE